MTLRNAYIYTFSSYVFATAVAKKGGSGLASGVFAMPENNDNPRNITNLSLEELQEEDLEVEITKDYGIGIDCHRDFIYVCVLIKRGTKVKPVFETFDTDWNSLVYAKQWCQEQILAFSEPAVDMSKPIHYVLESTAQYHTPVTLAWEGTPTIINPSIAGASKRKTDRLDARNLAHFDLNGTWRESYVPSMEIRELRLLIRERNQYRREATRCGNSINNSILGFGLTVGRDGSVVNNASVRSIVEDQLSDNPTPRTDICPTGIPADVRPILRERYQLFDECKAKSDQLQKVISDKVLSMEWETGVGTLHGDELLSLLTTAPHVGELTAMTFMAFIITPRRFPNSKAIAAYCGLDPSLKISAGKVTSTVKRGGHKALHGSLCMCASTLIRSHNEMFGRWGYQLYCRSGKWKKAVNAVARKLASGMYFVWMSQQPFSYEKYNIAREIEVFDIPVEELALLNRKFKRYIKPLHNFGLFTTKQLANAYLSCTLKDAEGLGKAFFSLLDDFFKHHREYQKMYFELKKPKEEQKREQA